MHDIYFKVMRDTTTIIIKYVMLAVNKSWHRREQPLLRSALALTSETIDNRYRQLVKLVAFTRLMRATGW